MLRLRPRPKTVLIDTAKEPEGQQPSINDTTVILPPHTYRGPVPDELPSFTEAPTKKAFCDIGLVVDLERPCVLCTRQDARCEQHWLLPNTYKPYPQRFRLFLVLVMGIIGLFTIGWLERLFGSMPQLQYLGVMLLGKDTGISPSAGGTQIPLPAYPYTIQNLMILLFFFGLGEALFRGLSALQEKDLMSGKYLPKNGRRVLDLKALATIRRRIGRLRSEEQGFIFVLADLCIKRFINTGSISQTLSALTGKLELLSHKLDLRYTALRYLIWVLPTIGFIGTVLGISFAIMSINPSDVSLEGVIQALGIAFNTTLVALVLSALLNLAYNMALSAEEDALNQAGNYVLNSMLNRIDPALDAESPIEIVSDRPNINISQATT